MIHSVYLIQKIMEVPQLARFSFCSHIRVGGMVKMYASSPVVPDPEALGRFLATYVLFGIQVDKSAEVGHRLFAFCHEFRLLPCRIWQSYSTNPLLVLAHD